MNNCISAAFLEYLIGPCMVERRFREKVAGTILSRSFPANTPTGLSELLCHLVRNLPTTDSPYLFAAINEEGRV